MNFPGLMRIAHQAVLDNAPAIATAIGVVGTVTTAILAAKGAHDSAEPLRVDEARRILRGEPDATVVDKAKLVWQNYVPAAGMGAVTIAAIISANRISQKRAAALAAAYSLSERAFVDYRQRVAERLNPTQERSIYDEAVHERVKKNPPKTELVVTDNGDVMCYDDLTGRYFMSSMEKLRRSVNDVNEMIINGGYASLSEFYEKIGLSPTSISEELGWTSDSLLEVMYSTVLSEDNKPCIAISFRTQPVRNYFRISKGF